ncbi:MAG: hypothetical protein R3E88_12375 [Myxococcota bacterium]
MLGFDGSTPDRRTPTLLALFGLVALVGAGCASAPAARGPVAPGAGIAFDVAKLETDNGQTALVLERDGEGVRLLDGRRLLLAAYAIDGRTITVRDADDRIVGRIEDRGDAFVLTPGDGDAARALRLTREPDGDLALERGEAVLFDLKAREYGYKIVAADGSELGRVRAGDGRIAVRNEARETVRQTRAPMPAAGVACLVLPGLALADAGGLSVATVVWGLPE